MRPLLQIVGVLGLTVIAVACFRGDERDKEAPPGLLGGLCLAPDGQCEEGTCNKERNYCYDQLDPCRGFFCGGEDRGMCTTTENQQPRCICEPGFNNQLYELYCCPETSTGIADPKCIDTSNGDDDDGDDGDGDGDGDDGGESESGSDG